MATDYRCFFCFNRAVERFLQKEKLHLEKASELTHDMIRLYLENQAKYLTPQFARELHAKLKQYTNNPDPYQADKQQSNDLILNQYQKFKTLVESSPDSFDTALRLAIAGNIIDAAVSETYQLDKTISLVLESEFSIDHSNQLQSALKKAKTVLYLGDNNGEIVLDKLLIETINHPNLIYAVKDQPIINDVTLPDATYVGMNQVAPVISNGYDAPSTILEHCSDEFLSVFNQADVIISKGQGNLEGLWESSNKNIFFLLMVKCDVIAEKLGVEKGNFVVTRNLRLNE